MAVDIERHHHGMDSHFETVVLLSQWELYDLDSEPKELDNVGRKCKHQ